MAVRRLVYYNYHYLNFKKIPRAHAQLVKQSPIVLSVSPAPVFEMQAILLSLNNFKLFENLKNMIWSIFSSCYIAIHVYNNYKLYITI